MRFTEVPTRVQKNHAYALIPVTGGALSGVFASQKGAALLIVVMLDMITVAWMIAGGNWFDNPQN